MGIATSNTAWSGRRSTPMARNTPSIRITAKGSARLSSGVIMRKTTAIKRPTAAQEDAGKDSAQHLEIAESGVSDRKRRHDQRRRQQQPGKGGNAAGDAAQPRSEHHRQIDDVGPGQEVAERKGLVELVRGHPAVLLDDRAAGKHQDPAETGQRHPGEGQKQRDQARRGGGEIRLLDGRC